MIPSGAAGAAATAAPPAHENAVINDPDRPRHAFVLACALWVLWALLSAVTVWLTLDGQSRPLDHLTAVAVAGFATVGALVGARHPRNAVGWLLLAFALSISLMMAGESYAWTGYPGYVAAAWLANCLQYVALSLVLVFLPLLFPDGMLLSTRWRPVLWLGVAALAMSVIGIAFSPRKLDVAASIPNPLGAAGSAGQVFGFLEALGIGLLGVTELLTATSVVLRFRRSRGAERQQLKWFAFAGLVMLAGWTMGAVDLVLPGDQLGSVGWTIFGIAALVGLPSATAIAIFRYRLYDIDVVINRTLVYGTLTVALLATYVVSVLVLQPLLRPLTGDSDLAVAGSTLAVAALFRPARRRIQSAVDRRFYRRKYDAARTLDAFTAHLRHELDLDAVARDLRSAAEDTMQPAHISLWLRP